MNTILDFDSIMNQGEKRAWRIHKPVVHTHSKTNYAVYADLVLLEPQTIGFLEKDLALVTNGFVDCYTNTTHQGTLHIICQKPACELNWRNKMHSITFIGVLQD